jgi:hypothetical protein
MLQRLASLTSLGGATAQLRATTVGFADMSELIGRLVSEYRLVKTLQRIGSMR